MSKKIETKSYFSGKSAFLKGIQLNDSGLGALYTKDQSQYEDFIRGFVEAIPKCQSNLAKSITIIKLKTVLKHLSHLNCQR